MTDFRDRQHVIEHIERHATGAVESGAASGSGVVVTYDAFIASGASVTSGVTVTAPCKRPQSNLRAR